MSGARGAGGIRGRRGQALAEFALVLPVLFLLIAGIIEFGRAWNIKQAVTDAAREGARYTVVRDDAVPDTVAVGDKIRERLALAGITGATISIGPGDDFRVVGQPMTVSVSTQYRMGWVGAMLAWAGAASTITINTTSTMRNE